MKAGSGCRVYGGAGAIWLSGAHQQQTATQRERRVGLGANPDALQQQSVLPRQPHVHSHGAGCPPPRPSSGLAAVRRGSGPRQAQPEWQQGQQQQQWRRRRRRRRRRRPRRGASGGAHGRTQGRRGSWERGEAEGARPQPDGAGRREGRGRGRGRTGRSAGRRGGLAAAPAPRPGRARSLVAVENTGAGGQRGCSRAEPRSTSRGGKSEEALPAFGCQTAETRGRETDGDSWKIVGDLGSRRHDRGPRRAATRNFWGSGR